MHRRNETKADLMLNACEFFFLDRTKNSTIPLRREIPDAS